MTASACTLCPRACGAERSAGQLGYCRMPAGLRLARAAPHFWEEPCISGDMGSGAVFFSGCTLRCRFCQNSKISAGGYGAPVTAERLREIFRHLIEVEGCHNLNLVTGTQFLPEILKALDPKPPVPVVWNTGGYESMQTLKRLDGVVDIYLPDLKYRDGALAASLSGAPDYPDVAAAAILEMARQTGPAQFDEDGVMTRGTLVRHLVLPGYVDNSLSCVEWVAEHFPDGSVPLSLMSQYTPMPGLEPPLDRRVTADEYAAVCSWAEMCGIKTGYVQDFASASEDYIPDFSLEGVLSDDPQ